MKRCGFKLRLFCSKFEHPITGVANVLNVASAIASLACLIALTVYMGYNLGAADRKFIWSVLRIVQSIFGFTLLFNLVLRFKSTVRQSKIIKWIVDLGLLLSFIAWAYPQPAVPWMPWLSALVYSNKFLFGVLGAYSLVVLSYTISRIPGRRTNPSLIMAGSFLFFIVIGSFALMLPRCTYHGISYFDSLFVASSAVCITGLTPVDIPTTFTPMGIIVLSVLVQLGSLGVITFTSFFAMFYTGSTSIYNQLLLRDIIYSKSMNALMPTLIYVLGFTITIELLGAVGVYFSLPEGLELSVGDKVAYASFHSMSAFCNAGFSCFAGGMSNPVIMAYGQWLYIVTTILVIAGAIGFPILVNLREILFFYISKMYRRLRGLPKSMMRLHVFDLNTKLVLCTTSIIFLIGSLGFFVLEYHNTLNGMPLGDKIIQSVFNAVIPRSAGFASVNPNSFLNATLLLVLVQMIIGGSSQSMAGGVKVNTIAALWLNLRAVLRGHEGASAFGRTLNKQSVRRATAVFSLSLSVCFVYILVIMLLEPQLSAKSSIFETISAFFTVGSSLGATPMLSDASKAVLSTAMFFGRVGLLSILCGVMAKRRDLTSHLPIDNIIIN